MTGEKKEDWAGKVLVFVVTSVLSSVCIWGWTRLTADPPRDPDREFQERMKRLLDDDVDNQLRSLEEQAELTKLLAERDWSSAAVRVAELVSDTRGPSVRRLLLARARALLEEMDQPDGAVRVFANTSLERDLGDDYLRLLRCDSPVLQAAVLERLVGCADVEVDELRRAIGVLVDSTDDSVRARVARWVQCLDNGERPPLDEWPANEVRLPESNRMLYSAGGAGGFVYRRVRPDPRITFDADGFTEADLPELRRQFEAGDDVLRLNVMHVLRTHRWPDSIDVVRTALVDDSGAIRHQAVQALRLWSDPVVGWDILFAHATASTLTSRDVPLIEAVLGNPSGPVDRRQAFFLAVLESEVEAVRYCAMKIATGASRHVLSPDVPRPATLQVSPLMRDAVALRCLGDTLDPSDKALRLALELAPTHAPSVMQRVLVENPQAGQAHPAIRVIHALRNAAASMTGAQLVGVLGEACRSPHDAVRHAATRLLMAVSTTSIPPELLPLLGPRLADADAQFATDLLGDVIDHLEQPGVWKMIAEAAESMRPELARLQVLRLLPEIDARAIPTLLKFARNPDAVVRGSALWGLQFVADRELLPSVLLILADPEPEVVLAAIATVDRLNEKPPAVVDTVFAALVEDMAPRELFREIGDRKRLYALMLGRIEQHGDPRVATWLTAMHHVAPSPDDDVVVFWSQRLGVEPVSTDR